MSSVDLYRTHRELSSVRILRNFYVILKYNKTSTSIKQYEASSYIFCEPGDQNVTHTRHCVARARSMFKKQ
jgi:hypothetical protein